MSIEGVNEPKAQTAGQYFVKWTTFDRTTVKKHVFLRITLDWPHLCENLDINEILLDVSENSVENSVEEMGRK